MSMAGATSQTLVASPSLLLLVLVSCLPRGIVCADLTGNDCEILCKKSNPYPVIYSDNTLACEWFCGTLTKPITNQQRNITVMKGCVYTQLRALIPDTIASCSPSTDPVIFPDPFSCMENTTQYIKSSQGDMTVPIDCVRGCIQSNITALLVVGGTLKDIPSLPIAQQCSWTCLLKMLQNGNITEARNVVFTPEFSDSSTVNKFICNYSNALPLDSATANKARFSANLTWLCLMKNRPTDGSDLVIEQDLWLLVDTTTPSLRNVVVNGALEVLPGSTLRAAHITVQGRMLISRRTEFQQGITRIILTGSSDPFGRGLAIFGSLALEGSGRSYKGKLAATAPAGTTTITLLDNNNLQEKDEILITASGFSFQENEVRTVALVEKSKITLTAALEFSHWVSSDGTLASDVVLLSRDLVVEMKSTSDTSGSAPAWIYLGKNQTGEVSIQYADFHFPSELSAGAVQPFSLFASENVTKANIKFSVFRGGFGPSIKIAGTNNVLENCVVFDTSGSGIVVTGQSNTITSNLVTTSASDYGVTADYLPAAIEVVDMTNGLAENVVAGFKYIAYRLNGSNSKNANEAHSGLYGVYVTGNFDTDVIVREFLVWKSWNYGVYIQVNTNVTVTNVTLADNGVGVFAMVYTAFNTSTFLNKFITISASTIIGASSDDTCGNVAPQNSYTAGKLNALPVPDGRVGVLWPIFTSNRNKAPAQGHHAVPTNYSVLNGQTNIDTVTFMNFVSTCQGNKKGSAAIATNGLSEDFQHPIVIKGSKLQNVNDESKIYMHMAKKNVALGCLNAACDGKRTALLTDTDGSFLGTKGTAVPTADNLWGDPSLGIGDNWVPKIALTWPNDSTSTLASVASKKGVFVDGCKNMGTWWNCGGVEHAVLAMQSMDADFTSRPFSPAALLSPDYVNVLNGPPLHAMESCPKDGPCSQTASVFHGIVNTANCHRVYFLRYPPHTFRLALLSGKPDTKFKVGLFYPKDLRFRVSVNHGTWTSTTVGNNISCLDAEQGFNNYYRILYLNLHAGDLVDVQISNTAGISFTARNTTDANAPTTAKIRRSVAAKTNSSEDKIEVIIEKPQAHQRKRRSTTDDLDPIIYIAIIADINNGNLDDAALNINSKADFDAYILASNLRDKLTASVLSGQLSADLGFDLSNISVVDPLPAVGSQDWTEVTYTDVIFESPYMSSLYGLRIFSFPKKMLARKSFVVMVQAIDKNSLCVNVGGTSWTLTVILKDARGKPAELLRGHPTINFRGCWGNYTDLQITTTGAGFVMQFIINQNTQYQVSTNPFSVEEERASLAKNVLSIIVGGILGALVFIAVGTGGFFCHKKRNIQEIDKPPMM
ncbi:fibrocystin-L-like isoform X2 [Petromyzon marinus]|uniref:Fibrocystin-L-like isoform X2 n=1 Tax=Petromyzon marinus TaxID=7757 RepID=A0AAJ7X9A2_PETMA|nr:fibrocystin-L-like isoform X2 [Petromyzon marinus]